MAENDYKAVFISEVKEHLIEIFSNLNNIEKGGGPKDSLLFDLFRRFHTIKGMANTMGQTKMAQIAHNLEGILEYIRKRPETIFSLKDIIIRGVNAISLEIDNFEKGGHFVSDDILSELSSVLEEMKARSQRETVNQEERDIKEKDLDGLYETLFEIERDSKMPSLRAFLILKEFSSGMDVIHSVPSYDELKGGIKTYQIKIYTKDRPDQEFVRRIIERVGESRFLSTKIYKKEKVPQRKEITRYIRIPFERVDELTSAIDELLLVWNKYRYSLEDKEIDPHILRVEYSFKKVLNYAERLRTVPLKSLIPKIAALTESTARSLHKDVKLVIKNEEIEIDKSIIDRLEEPLMHLIRNSIYHGIESVEERRRIGKPEAGTIELRFEEREEFIAVSVRDDGRGIDREKILKKALEKDLIKTETGSLSDDEIIELIFLPGFSTAQEADMTSGRGFGMDIVRNVVWQMGGDIKVNSIQGRGTETILMIPYQFANIKVIIGEIGGFRYAFPVSRVQGIVRREDTRRVEEGRFIVFRDEKVRLLNYRYNSADFFILFGVDNRLMAAGLDEILFIGETRLYKIPYVLKSNRFLYGMVIYKGICPVPVVSIDYLREIEGL